MCPIPRTCARTVSYIRWRCCAGQMGVARPRRSGLGRDAALLLERERGLTFEVPVDKMDAQIMVIITEVCVCVRACSGTYRNNIHILLVV